MIQRMNEDMELVQEVEIGKSNTFRVTLGQDDLYAEGVTQALDNRPFFNEPVTDLFLYVHLRRTNFFDALERAIENPEITTTFEPAV